MTAAKRVVGIDQLRGLAVALVVLRHAFPSVFPGAGVVGVVMFFTLSGHLITGLLLDELDDTGRLRLRRFYLRRAFRLLPALVAMLVAVVVVTLVLNPLDDRDQLLRTVLAALTFTGDLPFGHGSDATFHVWTLATEEQFYLVWPAFLLLAHRRGRTVTGLVVAAAIGVLASILTMVWLHDDPGLGYSLPTPWATCFVIGACSRVHLRSFGARRLPTHVLIAAPAALALLSALSLRGHATTYLLGGPVIAALTAVLLIDAHGRASLRATPTPIRSIGVLTLKACAILGTVSYGVYLWNYPLTVWLRPELGGAAGIVGAALSIGAAALSWAIVEKPAARLGRRMLARAPVVPEQVR